MNNDETFVLAWASQILEVYFGWTFEKLEWFKPYKGYCMFRYGVKAIVIGTTLDDIRRFIAKLPPKVEGV